MLSSQNGIQVLTVFMQNVIKAKCYLGEMLLIGKC